MTAVERATLERLEDALTKRLDTMSDQLDAIEERVRRVELDQARYHGATDERALGGSRRMQIASFALAIGVSMFAIPGLILTIINIVGALSK